MLVLPRPCGRHNSRSCGLVLVLLGAFLACSPGAAVPAAEPAAQPHAPAERGEPASPPAPAIVQMALPAQTALVAILMIAQLEGFYERHGVQMEYSLHQGGPPALQAMMAGAADLTLQVTGTVLNAIQNGAQVVIVASNQGDPDHQLFARPEISSVAALEGKRVAAADPGSELNTITRKTLEHYGLPPDRYDLVPVGATNARFTALTQGAVDATLLQAPLSFDAETQGLRRLGRSGDAVPNYLYTVLATKRDWGRQHADTLVRFLRGYQDAIAWVYAPENKARVIEHWVQISKASPEAATRTYDLYISGPLAGKVVMRGGAVPREGIQAVLDMMLESEILKRPLTVDEVVDLTYLERAGQR